MLHRLKPLIAVLLLVLGFVSLADAAKRPPNIVVFLVDDMGWNDTEPYGNKFHETPNVTKLAKQGMRFTNAYAACPVCSPTRVSIMTGRYPARVGITDFIPGHLRPWAKLTVPPIHNQLPLSEVSLAEMVKPAGYVSGSFGKWHLGGRTHYPDKQGFDDWIVTGGRHFAPRFRTTPKVKVKKNEYLGDFLTRHAERFIEKNRDKPFLLYLPHYAVHIPLEAKEKLVAKYRTKRSRAEHRPELRVRIRWQGYPIKAINEQVIRPMMSVLLKNKISGALIYGRSYHGGATGSAEYRIVEFPNGWSAEVAEEKIGALIAAARLPRPKRKDAPKKKAGGGGAAPGDGTSRIQLPAARGSIEVKLSPVNHPTYAAMVEHIDQSLGRIMKKLDDLKLADNTVLIFFSDNGGLYRRFDQNGPAVMSNYPLRDEKGSLYEGGIREPCIIRWPSVVKPGSVSKVPITSVDFWPTIAEIAGTRKKFKHAIDGESLVPVLKYGDTRESPSTDALLAFLTFDTRALYWHYPHYHHTTPGGAIRKGDYKLIEYFEDGKLELYNLKDDIGETTDLSKKQPSRTKKLHAMLKAWRKKVGAKMPTKNKYYDPKRAGEWRNRRRFKRKM